MRKLIKDTSGLFLGIAGLFVPAVAFAVGPNDLLTRFINNIIDKILQPIIWLLFALALYYFVLGISMFMLKADDPKARAKGRDQMIWGVIGIFIMVSVGSILYVVTNTFGVALPANTVVPR